MSDEVTILVTIGGVNEAPIVRVLSQETVVTDSGDMESVLLDAGARLLRLCNGARDEAADQIGRLLTQHRQGKP